MFSAAYVLCSNLPLLVLTLYTFLKPLKECVPHFRCIDKTDARSIISLGGIFFICQILYMLISNTNEFFVSQYTSPENVVDYQIYYKLFSLGSMLFMLALSPVWSVVSKAIAEKDFQWLKKLYRRIKVLSWLGVFCEFLLILPLQWIICFWLKDAAIRVNYAYAVIFALFGSAMLYQSALSTIVGGMGKMKLQAICYGVGFILKVLIIHFGIELTGSWILITLSNAVILIPYCILQQIWLDHYFKQL
jgi:O-antigen/teichoic acid export membrane protein